MKVIVILLIFLALQAVLSFSALEKSRDSTTNSPKLVLSWFFYAENERTACKAEQIHKIATIFTQNGPRL